jgi:hypothetical protein
VPEVEDIAPVPEVEDIAPVPEIREVAAPDLAKQDGA